jgi:copper chaperone CopZ
MTTRQILGTLLLTIAFACGQAVEPAPPPAMDVPRTVSEVQITDGTPVTTVDLEIGGMTCMMSCGRAVEKALAALPGVSTTTIQFNEGDEADHAIITYDESKVTDAQMIEAIGKVHDGAYKVVAVKITKQVLNSGTTAQPMDGPAADAGEGEVSVEDVPVVDVIPSLLGLLSRLARI